MLAVHPRGGQILKLVQEKQRLMKDAWLTETGHQRPGMNKGFAGRGAGESCRVGGSNSPAHHHRTIALNQNWERRRRAGGRQSGAGSDAAAPRGRLLHPAEHQQVTITDDLNLEHLQSRPLQLFSDLGRCERRQQ